MIAAFACACSASAGELGANKFDLIGQYTGRASGGDGSAAYLRVTRAMARKAILDAADAGFTFLRIGASGYSPSGTTDRGENDLSLWMKDPAAYWRLVDAMFDDLDRANIKLVPTFVWNPQQFPAAAGDSERAMIADPGSKSRALLKKYTAEFVERYKSRKTILFYELTNELDLAVDLDLHKRCLARFGKAANCDVASNFTTDEMIAFSRDMVTFLKQHDPSRQVTSGYSLPRRSSFHLALRPEFSPSGPDWTQDTIEQFGNYLSRTQAPFDIFGVHVYQNNRDVRYGRPPNTEYTFIADAAAVARADGKKLFVGEFGDDGASSLTPNLIKDLSTDTVAYASVWIWEFYQFQTNRSFDTEADRLSLEPGFTDARIATLTAALAKPLASAESAEPRVVLTRPLPCSAVNAPVELSAVASGPHSDPIDHVDFLAGDTVLGSSNTPPFQLSFQPAGTGAQAIVLSARAVTHAGRTASFQAKVLTNHSSEACLADDH